MGKNAIKPAKKLSSGKQIQKQVADSLLLSLAGLKEILGEKKFEKRIKKAARLLSQGIKQKKSKKVKDEKKKKEGTEPANKK